MQFAAYIVMGVSGCGKSTIGKALADELQIKFYDGDDFHPVENVAKMESGRALNDDDRVPWLKAINNFSKEKLKNESLVIACSSLKKKYRNILKEECLVRFIYLKGSFELIQARVNSRKGHFMPAHLLRSQFETLEEPENAIYIDSSKSKEEIVENILSMIKKLA